MSDWEQMIATNINGLSIRCARSCPAWSSATGATSSPRLDRRRLPYPGGNVYGATKAFVSSFR